MLEARNLSVGPPGTGDPVVSNCSLQIGSGEWLGVTGPNGCGKTCLALALAGLAPARSGEVRLDGQALDPATRDTTAGTIAVVMQEPATQLLASTVHDELCFTARNLGRPESETAAAAARWSARFGLEPWWGCDPRALSAGWQQLVLLAAALVARPRVLIVDEGGAHLEPRLRHLVLAVLREQVNRGLSLVWFSQESEELFAADRILDLGVADSTSPSADHVAEPVFGAPLLRMQITPWAGSPGPHVRTSVGIEIEIPSSGIVALAGPNGCGKSVVLEAAAGLAECVQIELTWLAPPHPIPVLAGQYPEQQICCETVEDEVSFAAIGRGAARDWAIERGRRLLAGLGMDDPFLRRRMWDLSAGEKRIVEVVAALSTPAQLVLLDEPTCGLDQGRKFGLAKLVSEQARAIPIVVASQDRAWLATIGARVLDWGGRGLESDAKLQPKNGLTETCPSA